MNEYKPLPVVPKKPLNNSFTVAKLVSEKKRGQPLTQKQVPRSQSLEKVRLDLVQRRDLKSVIDNRLGVIARSYDYHISQQ